MSPDRENLTTELRCVVKTVRFQRDNYAVCICATSDDIPTEAITDTDVLSEQKLFYAAGYGIKAIVDKELVLSGTWERNKKYNSIQFKVLDCADYVGSGRDAIVKYLSSGILKGVRRQTAEKIYDAFGDATISVLENEPYRLLSVPGIREKKLASIVQSFAKNQDLHMLTRILSPYNVSYRTIIRIRKALGEDAAAIVKENPYTLCRVIGVGFKTADDIAMKMGLPADSPARIKGAIIYAMLEAMNSKGHVYIQRSTLFEDCVGEKGILHAKNRDTQIDPEIFASIVDEMLANGDLVQPKLSIEGIEPDVIFLPRSLIWETMSSYNVAALIAAPLPPNYPDDWLPFIRDAEEDDCIELADTQRRAVQMALSSQFSIITGGPGSGKTSSLRIVTKAFLSAIPGATIVLAAPTGRAARRMAEQTGMDASTIHRLLELKPDDYTDFRSPCEHYLEADFVIIDEASMIDAALFAELMYRIMPGTKMLLLGDADQLPSVGPGNVLRELLSIPDVVPSIRLDKVFRQGEDSIIPLNAAKIRNGETNLMYSRDQFFLKKCANEEKGASIVKSYTKKLVETEKIGSAQILCPLRKRGNVSTQNINNLIHDVVNPPSLIKPEIVVGGTTFRLGDKVMQTRNTPNVSNGDIGYVVHVSNQELANLDENTGDQPVLQVRFDAYQDPIPYTYEEAMELEPANAITIHKAQGGEFDIVMVPIFRSMSFFLHRNLIYTAVTRAKKQVVIISDEDSLYSAIRHEDFSKRNSALARLTRYCAQNPTGVSELYQA